MKFMNEFKSLSLTVLMGLAVISCDSSSSKHKGNAPGAVEKKTVDPVVVLEPEEIAANLSFPRFELRTFDVYGTLPGETYTSSYPCYELILSKKALPGQVIYRVKAFKEPNGDISHIKITGFHLTGKMIIEHPVPRRPGPEETEYNKFCSEKIVEASFQGHQASAEFDLPVPNSLGKLSLDEILTEDAGDVQKLIADYGPIFKSANKISTNRFADIPFFGSDAYDGVDNRDPVAIIMAAMKKAKSLKSELSSSIHVLRVSDSL